MAIAPIVILAAAALIVQTYMHSRKAALGGGISLSLAIIALTFRTVDLSVCSYIPMGTHFLWHLLNALVLYRLLIAATRFRA